MDATQLVQRMKDVPVDSILFVSYLAGRRPTPRAYQEASRSIAEGIAPRHFTGRFVSLTFTKRFQEPVLTLWVEERDSTNKDSGQVVRGAYRAFNPCLGKLLTLSVVERAQPKAQ